MDNKAKTTQEKIDKAILDIKNFQDINIYIKKMAYIEKIVLDYLDENGELENERRKLINKYKNLLETPFKHEIIGQIRTEVRLKYPAMGIEDLLLFSINVYTFATLKVYKVPEQEIINKIITVNNEFLNILQNQDKIIIDREMEQPTLEYLQSLISKYQKIIKERI